MPLRLRSAAAVACVVAGLAFVAVLVVARRAGHEQLLVVAAVGRGQEARGGGPAQRPGRTAVVRDRHGAAFVEAVDEAGRCPHPLRLAWWATRFLEPSPGPSRGFPGWRSRGDPTECLG